MNSADPNFFILLVLGGAILYGLAPVYGAFFLALAGLWVLGKARLLFFVLAGLWLVRKLVFDFAIAWVAGLGFGLGARGRTRRTPRPWTRAAFRRDQRFRRLPRGYSPNDDFDDDFPETLNRR